MALLWRQAKNPTYTDKVLSSVENKIEKNTWYQKWVSELSQVVWPVFITVLNGNTLELRRLPL